MSRGKSTGISRRPIEYILIAVLAMLILFLVWSIREIDSKDVNTDSQAVQQQDDGDISQIVESGLSNESSIDESYDEWEQDNGSAADGLANNIEGAYDESSY